jgi:hypothetical protein
VDGQATDGSARSSSTGHATAVETPGRIDSDNPPPLEELAEVIGINDSDTPDAPTDPKQFDRR